MLVHYLRGPVHNPLKSSLFNFMYSRVSVNGPPKSLGMPSELSHRETQDYARQVSAAPSLPALPSRTRTAKSPSRSWEVNQAGGLRRNTTKSQACVSPTDKCHGS